MADNKTPSKAPVSSKSPESNVPPKPSVTPPVTPPVTPVTPVTPTTDGDKKPKRPVQQVVWPTAEAAKEEADKRTYGPRKAYTVKVGNTTVHCVAYNDQYAAYEAFIAAGGEILELGGTTRAKKPLSKESVLAAAASMPKEQLDALRAELAKL